MARPGLRAATSKALDSQANLRAAAERALVEGLGPMPRARRRHGVARTRSTCDGTGGGGGLCLLARSAQCLRLGEVVVGRDVLAERLLDVLGQGAVRLAQSKRLLIESWWMSKPLAIADKLRPRRLNN
eukprot:SAG25_NODE_880_length_4970_cov_4.557380_5_plen_128_part_00